MNIIENNEKTVYSAPQSEVIEMYMTNAILDASGDDWGEGGDD